MLNNTLYLARQPILNRSEEIVAYEFFYRNGYGECNIDDPRHATASVLVNLLNQIGSEGAFGQTLAFINTDGPLLLTDILRTLPKEKFVFELSASMKINARIHEAIRYYHSLGYRFALDNASFHPHYLEAFSPIFPFIEFAKFDVTQTDIEQFRFSPNPYGKMKWIAQKVEFFEMAEAYKAYNFEYFQGFYFAKAHMITQKRIDPEYSEIMSLFSLLQKDAPLADICDFFKKEGSLSLQLIQFLRSAHPGILEESSSIREMLEKLGKGELIQWLMLIIYSKSGTKSLNDKNPYTVFAQNRIDTMVSLLSKLSPEPTEKEIEQTRLIAMFSLLEGLMNVPIERIIEEIKPGNEIEDALITHTGKLGRIYAAALKVENGDINGAAVLLHPYTG